jgi:hypothetical protein
MPSLDITGDQIRRERRSAYRANIPHPVVNFIADVVLFVTFSVIAGGVVAYIRHPTPMHYVQVGDGALLTGEVRIKLGTGVVATTLRVGDRQVILVERTKP